MPISDAVYPRCPWLAGGASDWCFQGGAFKLACCNKCTISARSHSNNKIVHRNLSVYQCVMLQHNAPHPPPPGFPCLQMEPLCQGVAKVTTFSRRSSTVARVSEITGPRSSAELEKLTSGFMWRFDFISCPTARHHSDRVRCMLPFIFRFHHLKFLKTLHCYQKTIRLTLCLTVIPQKQKKQKNLQPLSETDRNNAFFSFYG